MDSVSFVLYYSREEGAGDRNIQSTQTYAVAFTAPSLCGQWVFNSQPRGGMESSRFLVPSTVQAKPCP